MKKVIKKKSVDKAAATLTIRGAASHDDITAQAIIHWFDMQKLAYHQDRKDYSDVMTARYLSD